jgi:hypothetical protein
LTGEYQAEDTTHHRLKESQYRKVIIQEGEPKKRRMPKCKYLLKKEMELNLK